jgi:hypothetical protein
MQYQYHVLGIGFEVKKELFGMLLVRYLGSFHNTDDDSCFLILLLWIPGT